MSDLFVLDDETLYRRIPDRPGNYVRQGDIYRVSSAAFGDRWKKQPSVDRASLRNSDPQLTKIENTDLVVSLIAVRVRKEAGVEVIRSSGVETPVSCKVDVVADPLGEHSNIQDRRQQPPNPAHALITAIPSLRNEEENVFKKLKKALARLSTWEISPPN